MRFPTRFAVAPIVAFALFTAFTLSMVGCGAKTHPQADIDKAQAAVVASLDNWKANEPISKLKTQNPAVDFNEELRNTQSLTEFTVIKVHATDPDVVRVVVTLKLKDKKGKLTEREAVYSVALRTPIVVARDPYF